MEINVKVSLILNFICFIILFFTACAKLIKGPTFAWFDCKTVTCSFLFFLVMSLLILISIILQYEHQKKVQHKC